MKYIQAIENAKISMEIVECDCGYHMGFDATYLDQVGDTMAICPACFKEITTAGLIPD